MCARTESGSLPGSKRAAGFALHRWLFGALFVLALAGLGFLAWRGWSYYSTPLVERPRHADYWLLKPGGEWGRLYGIGGATLLVLMLSYTVRKRVDALRRLGTLRVWLSFHIFCGVIGSLLILLHTSLKFGGLVALSFWSMVVVALSGVLGRYLYRQIPRARGGAELSLRQAEERESRITAELRQLGVGTEGLARLEWIASQGPAPETGLGVLLLRMPWDDLRLRLALSRFGRSLREVPRPLRKRAVHLAGSKARLRRRILLWDRLQRLFYYWHVLHKPFAVVMYLFMLVHIAVVTMAGYGFGAG